MISGMILNLLSDAKIRLYRLSHFFEDKPMPLIFPWKPDIVPSNFTEERSGNVLDEFYRSNPQKILRVKVFMEFMRQISQQPIDPLVLKVNYVAMYTGL